MKAHVVMIVLGGAVAMGSSSACVHSKVPAATPADSGTHIHESNTDASVAAISEVEISRRGCYGQCPVYTLNVKSDGSFRFEGERHFWRIGRFVGTIPLSDFKEVAQLILDSDYMSLADFYGQSGLDGETVVTTVVMNGVRKTIYTANGVRPEVLHEIQGRISYLLRAAKWSPAPQPDAATP